MFHLKEKKTVQTEYSDVTAVKLLCYLLQVKVQTYKITNVLITNMYKHISFIRWYILKMKLFFVAENGNIQVNSADLNAGVMFY